MSAKEELRLCDEEIADDVFCFIKAGIFFYGKMWDVLWGDSSDHGAEVVWPIFFLI